MALHGAVEVNGHRLWTWTATRTTREVPASQWSEYVVELIHPIDGVVDKGIVTHRYSDGSLVLAQKALLWASQTAKAKEMIPADPRDAERLRLEQVVRRAMISETIKDVMG